MAVVCLSANVADAAQWRLNERGECVHEWTASSLARGPLAMVNALTYPPRQLVGGGQAATEETSRSTGELILLTPTMALLGLGTGAMECVFVLGMGIADSITGGAFDLVPDESAEVSLAPMTPRFLEKPKPAPTTDPCGRPR